MPRTADLSAKHLQLVTKYKDLDVLGAVIRRACDNVSHRAGNQGEEKQHPRMLRIGELEDESEFLTPTRVWDRREVTAWPSPSSSSSG